MARKRKEKKERNRHEAEETQNPSNDHQKMPLSARKLCEDAASKSMDVLPINRDFAEHFESSKRRQFLSNVPQAIFDMDEEASSSDGEEEDEFGELLTKGIDRKVHETLNAIRNRDPRIYDKNAKFFEDANGQDETDSSDGEEDVNSEDEPVAGWDTIAKAAEHATNKLTLKDYVRETLLKNGKLSDDDDEGFDEEAASNVFDHNAYHSTEQSNQSQDPLHLSQERKKANDVNTVPSNDADDEDDDDNDKSDDEDFFTKKEKTAEELDEEVKDFEVFMKKRASKNSKQAGEDLLLHSYLEKETPDEKERFLRDFVLNNGWLDKNAGDAPGAKDYEIEIDTNDPDGTGQGPVDEEEFDEEVDKFEAQYNFRFEDPESAQIVSHARDIPDSMRRPDNRRKRAREARKMRKEQDKQEKAEEMKRLKNLKKREIQSRLLAIQEAAGDGVDLAGLDLEGDFDPEAFNKQMEGKFNEQYYSMKDEQMRVAEKEEMSNSTGNQILSKSRDDLPTDMKEDVKRMTDEYYNLDFEDIVGGMPMRFNYKHVSPESFNMTAEEILRMDEKKLNRLASLKYLAPYRSHREVQKQAWKVKAALQKQRKVERNGYVRTGEGRSQEEAGGTQLPLISDDADALASSSHKRKRRRSRSKTEVLHQQEEEQQVERKERVNTAEEDEKPRTPGHAQKRNEKDGFELEAEEPSKETKKKKRKKRKRNREGQESPDAAQMSQNRLKAYGITPP